MRLDFNVLWVDDQPDSVKAQIGRIQKQMEVEGFQFNATLCRSLDDLRPKLAENDGGVFADEIDLVLVDWDLGHGARGQEAIAEIRESIRYKDVVFYSGMTAPTQLRRDAFERGLEGVYCASRNDLVDEVIGVFESLVKKVLDLEHTRGIVMAATCDIDYIVNECLAIIHKKSNGEIQKALIQGALERIDNRIKELTNTAVELRKATSIMDFFRAHMILTSNDRLRLLSNVLKGKAFNVDAGARTAVNNYIQNVVPKRTQYAHVVLIPEGRVAGIADAEGKPITIEEARELRRLILRLRGDFRDLLAALHAHA